MTDYPSYYKAVLARASAAQCKEFAGDMQRLAAIQLITVDVEVLARRCEELEAALRDIQNAYGDPHAEDEVTTLARAALAATPPKGTNDE